MNAWYSTLKLPPLTPPSWVFSPVWTVLYVMIAVAILLYYRSSRRAHPGLTTGLLVIHLATNVIWTYLFFGLKSPGLALIDILVLDITLALLIYSFWRASSLAGLLLVPYFAWIVFATHLNYGFYRLN